jgi:predicted DNA-binding transcriptional regulator AlpA
MPDDAEEFLTDLQLADMLRVTPRTLLRWRRDGDGPQFVRAGARRLLYRRSDVLTWIDANTHATLAAETVVSKAARHEVPQTRTIKPPGTMPHAVALNGEPA